MTMKNGAKFKEKLACGLENDISKLTNFDSSFQKSQKWTL